MKRLDPRQLLVLAALGRNHSIHSAARDLSLTQSAVSKALAEIEAQIGASLFVRSRQGIEVNSLGKRVLSRVAHLLSVLDQGPGHHGQEQAVLRIGYVSDLHGMALGQAFVQWRQSQDLGLRLLERALPDGLHGLQTGELDAVLMDEPEENWPEQIRISNRMIPVLRTHHPLLLESREVAVPALKDLDWALPLGLPSFYRVLRLWMTQTGMQTTARHWVIPAGQGLASLVAQSDALAWLPAAQVAVLMQADLVRPLCSTCVPNFEIPACLLLAKHVRGDALLQAALQQFADCMDRSGSSFREY